jgi:hypothetical protein
MWYVTEAVKKNFHFKKFCFTFEKTFFKKKLKDSFWF